MPDTILTTKLFVPLAPAGLVARPRLVEQLNRGLRQGRRLSLVCAPPGYGKTTTVVEWLRQWPADHAQPGPRVAWLSLDGHDNDPARFLAYLTAALQAAHPAVAAALPPPASDDSADVMAALLNDLAALPDVNGDAPRARLILVLDDYHAVRAAAVHHLVEFFLHHQPPTVHLVLATREDPPLPLPRWRVGNQMTELRADDLRFTPAEALAFFQQAGVNLSAEAIAALDDRTEGWIAGLQLAALSLQGRSDVADFIAAFRGTHHYVIDYLLEEVLQRQPADIRDFLHATSVLDRLSASLCDAVTQRDDSRALLARLEHTNLFLIPLDDERQWYRYHHLFADSLAAGLDPARQAALHRRAAAWLDEHALLAQAVSHALAAQDFALAGHLIEKAARTTISTSGDLPALHRWSDLLPREILRAHPLLCLYYARSLYFKGQVHAADGYLDLAEQAIAALPAATPAQQEALGVLLTNRSTVAAMRGQVTLALQTAADAQVYVAADDQATQARLAHARGFAYALRGDLRQARDEFAQAVDLADAVGNRILGADVVGCLAQVDTAQGKTDEARRLCEATIRQAGDEATRPELGAVYLALGVALETQGETTAAIDALARAIHLARQAAWPHVLWPAYVRLALAHQAQGQREAARDAIEQAAAVARSYNVPFVTQRVAAYRATLDLAWGAMNATAHEATVAAALGAHEAEGDFADLTLTHLHLAHGQPRPAGPAGVGGVATAEHGASDSDTLVEHLSERELEVLRLIAAGRSNHEIAQTLVITLGTAKWHVSQIYGKLGVHSRVQALQRARVLGLL